MHGPSRVFDPRRHAWSSDDWAGRDARGAVTMEVHLGTFTPEGTLDAAIERLDHLVDLGVDMVELMPVAAFAGEHGWGYDGVALYAVHAPYGGPAALQRFVDAAHARGLAVCLDVVYNHLGPSGNYLATFGPYFTDRHETPWGQAVNLDDEGASEVRQWIVDNACRWLREFRIDALRLDAVHALVDDSDTHLLAELADRVDWLAAEVDRPLSLIAESDLNDPIMIEPTAKGGMGMTMQWADDVHHAINANVAGETHGYYVDFGGLDALEKVLTRVFVHDGGHSTFRGRDWGKPVPTGTDGRRFVAFSSDHDQTGNRALGDRPSARSDDDGLAIASALVLTSAFTPMLFMGDEWGARTPWQFFTDHREPELAEAIRKGRASEFGGHGWTALYGGEVEVPDPQARSTFERSRLDWSELDAPRHRRLLDWHRALIGLRRAEPELASGDLDGVRVTRPARGESRSGDASSGGRRRRLPRRPPRRAPRRVRARRVARDDRARRAARPGTASRVEGGRRVDRREPREPARTFGHGVARAASRSLTRGPPPRRRRFRVDPRASSRLGRRDRHRGSPRWSTRRACVYDRHPPPIRAELDDEDHRITEPPGEPPSHRLGGPSIDARGRRDTAREGTDDGGTSRSRRHDGGIARRHRRERPYGSG